MEPEDDKLKAHADWAKEKGYCEQCQFPWYDGLCECGHWNEPEVKAAELRGHQLLDELEEVDEVEAIACSQKSYSTHTTERTRQVHNKATKLWVEIVEDDSAGHPGAVGPSSDPNELWNEDILNVKSAIHTLGECLGILEDKERAKRAEEIMKPYTEKIRIKYIGEEQ